MNIRELLLVSEGDTENDFLYCGEQYNALTGLYYLRARYMNPTTGTFISEDSYAGRMHEPVTLHKYLYAHANPVKYTDPSGYYATYVDVLGAVALTAILVGVVEIGTGHLRTMLVSMMEDLESIKDSLGMWIRYYIYQAAEKSAEDAIISAKKVTDKVNDDSSGNVPANTTKAGKRGSKAWQDAKKKIRDGKGKGVNVEVDTKEEAEELINEARPGLQKQPTYSGEGKSGYEIHPPEPNVGNNKPHVKWWDWSNGKTNGAEGHIYYN